MPKFNVKMQRTIVQTKEFVVWAPNEKRAEEIATLSHAFLAGEWVREPSKPSTNVVVGVARTNMIENSDKIGVDIHPKL